MELDNRLASSKKIANQNELFTLKTNSALNSIRMVHLDLANLNVEKMSHNDVMKVPEKESNILSERLAEMLKGGVIMNVTTPDQAGIAEGAAMIRTKGEHYYRSARALR